MVVTSLDQQSLDLVLDTVDLVLQSRTLVGGDGGSDDWSGDTTSSTQSGSGWNKDVWNVLVLTQQWQVQQDLDWLGVCGHDDELGDTSVQGLGGLVGTLLQLTEVGSLLDNVEDLLGESLISEWESLWVWSGHID